jgi:hypothetical protein
VRCVARPRARLRHWRAALRSSRSTAASSVAVSRALRGDLSRRALQALLPRRGEMPRGAFRHTLPKRQTRLRS